ncbi:MAG: peptidylprolyl isomerase, partial [Halobacteriota archaeon]
MAVVFGVVTVGCLGAGDASRDESEPESRQSFARPTPGSIMSDRSISDPDNPIATIETTHGEITVELFEERAPRTVENFIGL